MLFVSLAQLIMCSVELVDKFRDCTLMSIKLFVWTQIIVNLQLYKQLRWSNSVNDGLQVKRRAEWPGQSIWEYFELAVPLWSTCLEPHLAIKYCWRQQAGRDLSEIYTEVEDMPEVPAVEIDSISAGDGLWYKSVKSVIGTDCCRKVLRIKFR